MSRDLSDSLNITKQGILSYSRRINSHTTNLSIAGALAGRKEESFLVTKSIAGTDTVSTLSKPITYIDQPGTISSSSIATNFAIGGKGFVAVQDVNGDTLFSRVGTFTLDKDRQLVNHLGHILQGIPTGPTGIAGAPSGGLTPVTIGSGISPPSATTAINMKLQLPINAVAGTPFSQNIPVIDDQGNMQTLVWTWEKKSTPPTAPLTSTWNLKITNAAIPGITLTGGNSLDVVFNAAGQPVTFGGLTTPPPITGTFPTGEPMSLALNLGTPNKLDGVALLGDEFSLKGFDADGHKVGHFRDRSIDQQGYVTTHYTNGVQQKSFRIPLADFNFVNGLDPFGAGTYVESTDSGPARFSYPGEEGSATIMTSNLEGSNVNPTQTYVDMIEDQQRYTNNLGALQAVKKMFEQFDQAISRH